MNVSEKSSVVTDIITRIIKSIPEYKDSEIYRTSVVSVDLDVSKVLVYHTKMRVPMVFKVDWKNKMISSGKHMEEFEI